MGTMVAMILVGSSLGYIIATKNKGTFFDKLQYIAVFAIISLILAVIIQIVIMKLNWFVYVN
tara:strand:- start:375 stop:560 length:186 start_codon:yes stop_codon:yes gene_type:complete